MKIFHFTGCWPTNIGNAFIDLGTKAMYEKAFPGCSVNFISSFRKYQSQQQGDVSFFKLVREFDIEYFSISGCCLNAQSLSKYLELFKFLRDTNPKIKILITGAGAWDYSKDIIDSRELISIINPDIFISRDDYSFGIGEGVSNRYSGIDCGFFVSDYYIPPQCRRKFITVADCEFFSPKGNDTVVHTYHDIFYKYKDGLNNYTSDLPEGYLTIYANSSLVYTTRIHAAVAGVSYKVPIKFIDYQSLGKRISLFNKVGIENFENQFLVDSSILEYQKSNQINFLRDRLN